MLFGHKWHNLSVVEIINILTFENLSDFKKQIKKEHKVDYRKFPNLKKIQKEMCFEFKSNQEEMLKKEKVHNCFLFCFFSNKTEQSFLIATIDGKNP